MRVADIGFKEPKLDLDQLSEMGINTGSMNFSTSGIVASLLFGIIGMWMFAKGKKKLNYTLIFTALALMFYPYFTKGPLQDWGVGIGLCLLAYYYWDNEKSMTS
jgi:hypothetical protein